MLSLCLHSKEFQPIYACKGYAYEEKKECTKFKQKLLRQNLFIPHNLKLQKRIFYVKWMVFYIFSFDVDNQNMYGKFTNIFVMQTNDNQQKI